MCKNKKQLMAEFAEWSMDVELLDGTQIYLELDYARKPYPLTNDAYNKLKEITELTNDIEPGFLAIILRGENSNK